MEGTGDRTAIIPRCAIAHRGCAAWRRPGIHTPGRGYGFRAHSLRSRPGMTKADLQIQRLVAAEDAVLVEGDAAVAGEIGLDIGSRGNAVVQIDQAGYPALEGFHAFGKCIAQAFDDL